LKDKKVDGVDAPIANLGKAGPYTLSDGSLGYHEICEKLLEGGWKIKYLTKNAAKVAVKGNEWMSYDDPETVYQKVIFYT
jgi:chitinase